MDTAKAKKLVGIYILIQLKLTHAGDVLGISLSIEMNREMGIQHYSRSNDLVISLVSLIP